MTTGIPGNDTSAPSLDELGTQADRTREELGRTMDDLTDGTAIPDHDRRKVTAMKNEAQEAAVHAAEAVRDTVTHAVHTVRDHTPKDVLDRAGQVTAQARGTAAHVGHLAADRTPPQLRVQAGRAMTAARANRAPLLVAAAAAVLTAVMLRGLLGGRR
ncbi:hypothetical protein [Kitasatospora sp. NBC_01539]|uniref:hypothetical protein n=1 Tax=Kitasatospora sp. NBC_01539 TaxID=2903577 RepID=UPI0038603107